MDDGVSAARPPFVDAHFHLWDHGVLRYPWLDAAENAAIAPDYRIADYRAELSAWNLVGAVHVDAGADPSQGADETVWLHRVAQNDGLPSGIVARVELNHPAVEPQLAWQAGHPRVKGIRHLINWHPTDPSRRAYDTDLTRDPTWRAGYALLGRYGLSYDFHGFPPQLAGLAEIAARHPEVPVILNHLALPIMADGLEEWRAGLIAFAAMPHAAIKLSGAGFIGPRFDPAGFADIVAEVIDRFGTDRVMVATNFPTDRLAADLDRTLGAYEALLTGFSDEERRDLWGRNANRIYRLGLNL
ncbi:amidohydrolase [Sphingomonas sanguinis]|uniref:Amidohydrolase n=1 Tax=Sphingomonas sanguinis TaxID=33051 RepID=A0A147I638_9SPHN|nr:amidohydrolase [Sphingomonas sanguinis]